MSPLTHIVSIKASTIELYSSRGFNIASNIAVTQCDIHSVIMKAAGGSSTAFELSAFTFFIHFEGRTASHL